MRNAKFPRLIALFILGFGAGLYGQEVSWVLLQEGKRYILEVSTAGAAPALDPGRLQLYVGERTEHPGTVMPSILGKVSPSENKLRFQPDFPFRVGLTYTAFYQNKHKFSFTIPNPGRPAQLIAIHPAAQTAPANLLKIYLHFSEPMGEGRAYEHLTLTNTAGDTVYQPFVPLQPELWSEDRRRLTLWLDPGRVKRGLLSHETHGVVIEQGEQYLLSVDPGWKDAAGNRLGTAYRKMFAVSEPDYQQPDPDRWLLELPRAGSLESLIIDFGESLDHALACRLIEILQTPDLPVAGNVSLDAEDSKWVFQPSAPWAEATYTLRIKGSLEDLAGNNLNRPFDRDLEKPQPAQNEEYYYLSFELKKER